MLWLQGIMGAGLASSLAGNKILNGCLLALSHAHIPTPSTPASNSSYTLLQSTSLELLILDVCVCICVYVCSPRGHQKNPFIMLIFSPNLHINCGHLNPHHKMDQTASRWFFLNSVFYLKCKSNLASVTE